jgi:hypothetical protein
MTIETRTTIEFSDILRVEFECPKCRARMTKELSDQNIVPLRCRNGMCSQMFLIEGSAEYAYLQGALDLMGRYAKAGQGGFSLRFELKPSPVNPKV